MDRQDLFTLISLLVSIAIMLTIVYHGGLFLDSIFGFGHLVGMVGVFLLIFGGAFLFGFFLMPGGEFVWSQEYKDRVKGGKK